MRFFSIYLTLIIVFVVSPLSAIFLSFSTWLLDNNRGLQRFTVLLLTIAFGYLNMNKIPESDLETYLIFYNQSVGLNMITYLVLQGKEPLFYTFTYLFFYLSNGNNDAYVFVITSIPYFIFSLVIMKMHGKMKLGDLSLYLALFTLFFFPLIFSYSAHLIRQFISISIVMLFLVNFSMYDSKKPWALIIASLIHTSSLFFATVYLLHLFDKVSKPKIILILSSILIIREFFLRFSNQLLDALSGYPILAYPLLRVLTENQKELEPISILGFALLVGTVTMLYLEQKRIKVVGLKIIFQMSLVLLIFVIINFRQTEMALRFAAYLYYFVPIALYCFIDEFSKKPYLKIIVSYSIVMVLSLWFLNNLENGAWSYTNVPRLVFIDL